MTAGRGSAHFAEIYGAAMPEETASRITDNIIAEMQDWANWPLDAGVCKSPAGLKRRYF